jgi:hypothetical protein
MDKQTKIDLLTHVAKNAVQSISSLAGDFEEYKIESLDGKLFYLHQRNLMPECWVPYAEGEELLPFAFWNVKHKSERLPITDADRKRFNEVWGYAAMVENLDWKRSKLAGLGVQQLLDAYVEATVRGDWDMRDIIYLRIRNDDTMEWKW